MGVKLGNRRFAPGLWPTLAVVVVLPAFLWLGSWQLDRAAFKRERLAAFEAPEPSDVLSMSQVLKEQYDAGSGVGVRHVTAEGAYDSGARHILLEQMNHGGKAGFYVLTPLRLADEPAHWVMINRGWVERDYANDALPSLPALDDEPRDLRGLLKDLPVPGLRVASALPSQANLAFPLAMLYPRAGDLQQVLGEPVYDGMVLLDPAAPDGFVREWQPRIDGPQKHMGYAVQWFSFAGTLLVLYLILNFKPADRAAQSAAVRRAAG
ncbi:MAG: SURF1 family protein [Pseudomonadota bacterium]